MKITHTLTLAALITISMLALTGCATHQADETPGMKVAPRSASDQAAVDRWRQARLAKRQAE